jgi:ABC-2 type transport system ATP-binding protein
LADRARAWELVVSGVSRDVIDRVMSRLTAVTPLGEDRFSLELPATTAPEALLAELVGGGARVVSLNPLRETLEDFFVDRVRDTQAERFLDKRRIS